jgi:hypothetical protein
MLPASLGYLIMIEIDKIKTLEELEECLKLSIDYFSEYESVEISIDPDLCKSNLFTLARRGDYFRVLKEDSRVVGWIAAKVIRPYLHSRQTALYQLYYHCNLSGYKAVKALILVHESMIEAAKEKNVDLAITSSELDNSDSFNRILTKQGWIKRNKSLIYPIN